jgi:hypothetical protein
MKELVVLTNHDRAILSWFDRMVKATHTLNDREALSLEAWLAAGEKRSTWMGWADIIGPMPERRKHARSAPVEMRKARTA